MLNKTFELLRSYLGNYKENSTEIYTRCIYCGDSRSNPRKMSLYISKYPVEKYGTYMFHCFRASCGMSGTLYQLLTDLNLLNQIPDNELEELTRTHKKRTITRTTTAKTIVKAITKAQVKHIDYKLDYIKQRLHIKTIPDYILQTVVTDFTSVFPYIRNELSRRMLKNIQDSYVGFKTLRNRYVIARSIYNTSSSELRYVKLKLQDGTDYYVTSPHLNKLKLTEPGTIILAEGIFSLLKGYLYIKDNISTQVILAATGGGSVTSYVNLYNYIIFELGIPDWNIIILSDDDVKPFQYSKILNSFYKVPLIFYNEYGDFGSANCRIQIYKGG